MQSPATEAPSPTNRSFAGALADFVPDRKFPPARDLDGLEPDVATLSYEYALMAHRRNRPVEPTQPGVAPVTNGGTAQPEIPSAPTGACEGTTAADRAPTIKKASVTVRLTEEENGQLRQRAAEAGMTVSAYLRSCAFEVESLRAQVKQMLSEVRQRVGEPASASLWTRLAHWRRAQPQARR